MIYPALRQFWVSLALAGAALSCPARASCGDYAGEFLNREDRDLRLEALRRLDARVHDRVTGEQIAAVVEVLREARGFGAVQATSPAGDPGVGTYSRILARQLEILTNAGFSGSLATQLIPTLKVPAPDALASWSDVEAAAFIGDLFAAIGEGTHLPSHLELVSDPQIGEKLLGYMRRAHAIGDAQLRARIVSTFEAPHTARNTALAKIVRFVPLGEDFQPWPILHSLVQAQLDHCLEFAAGCDAAVAADFLSRLMELRGRLGLIENKDEDVLAIEARLARGLRQPSIPIDESLRFPGELSRLTPLATPSYSELLKYLVDERIIHNPPALAARLRAKFPSRPGSALWHLTSVDERVVHLLERIKNGLRLASRQGTNVSRQEETFVRVTINLLDRVNVDPSALDSFQKPYLSRLHQVIVRIVAETSVATAVRDYLHALARNPRWFTDDNMPSRLMEVLLAARTRLERGAPRAYLPTRAQLERVVVPELNAAELKFGRGTVYVENFRAAIDGYLRALDSPAP